MKLLLKFVTIVLFCFCFVQNLKLSKDERSVNMLLKQLSTSPAIRSCNLCTTKSVAKHHVVKMLRSKLARVFPMTSLGRHDTSLLNKYRRTDFSAIRKFYNKSREQKGLLNYASSSTIFMYVFSPKDKWLANLVRYYFTLAFPTSIPKLLLICMDNSRRSFYVNMILRLRKRGIVDVEILEFSKIASRKKKIAANSHCFRVHSYNPFSKRYRVEILGKKHQLFAVRKDMNLHGSRFYTPMTSSLYYLKSRNPLNKRKPLRIEIEGRNSVFGRYLQSKMNVTYVCTDDLSSVDLRFPSCWMLYPYLSSSVFLKPIHLDCYRIYTPVIYDQQMNADARLLTLYFTGTMIIFVLLQLCKSMGAFHPRTWSPISVMTMLLGQSNPYGPMVFVETILFSMISVSGIFFSIELSNSVTDVLFPVEFERQFTSFDDLKSSNLTIFLGRKPRTRNLDPSYDIGKFNNVITSSNVSYKVYDWYRIYELRNYSVLYSLVNELVHSSNMAVTIVTNRQVVDIYGKSICVDTQSPRARRSDLIEDTLLLGYVVQPFSPFHERLSDLLWQFEEKGFDNFYIYQKVARADVHNTIFKLSRKNNQQLDEEEEESDNVITLVSVCVLSLGTAAAFLALLCERVLFKLSRV